MAHISIYYLTNLNSLFSDVISRLKNNFLLGVFLITVINVSFFTYNQSIQDQTKTNTSFHLKI